MTKKPKTAPTKFTKAQKKKIFAEYAKADDAVTEAREDLQQTLIDRSDVIQRISEGAGFGPFDYHGKKLKIMSRSPKGKPDQVTFFFRTEGSQAEKIE